jgi:hypothetical protein
MLKEVRGMGFNPSWQDQLCFDYNLGNLSNIVSIMEKYSQIIWYFTINNILLIS